MQNNAYNLYEHGENLAVDIGLEKMRQCCPHFNEWVSEMEGCIR